MNKILVALTLLTLSTQSCRAAEQPAAAEAAADKAKAAEPAKGVGRNINEPCNRNGCEGVIKFRESVLKCNKCGALAES